MHSSSRWSPSIESRGRRRRDRRRCASACLLRLAALLAASAGLPAQDVHFVGAKGSSSYFVTNAGGAESRVAINEHRPGGWNDLRSTLRKRAVVEVDNRPTGQEPIWQDSSEHHDALFGWAFASAGDVDGDGRADVVVGAPGARAGTNRTGKTYVFGLGKSIALDSPPELVTSAQSVVLSFTGSKPGHPVALYLVGMNQQLIGHHMTTGVHDTKGSFAFKVPSLPLNRANVHLRGASLDSAGGLVLSDTVEVVYR